MYEQINIFYAYWGDELSLFPALSIVINKTKNYTFRHVGKQE